MRKLPRTHGRWTLLAALLSAAHLLGSAEARAEKRAVPDYDGRLNPPPSVDEIALWAPRVLLAPLYLVSEYVLRRPLGFLVSTAEEEELPRMVRDLLTFGERRQVALIPHALFDFGFRPSVGLTLRWKEFLNPNNAFRLHFGTWGPSWLSGTLVDRFQGPGWRAQLRVSGTRRPDGLFYGIGSEIQAKNRSRYSFRQLDAELSFEADLWRSSEIRAFSGVRLARFGTDTCCDGPPVVERVEQGDFASLPPGFERGYHIYRQGMLAALDTRRPRPAPGSGFRVRVEGCQSMDFEEPLGRRWVTLGGALSAFADLSGSNHVVSLTIMGEVAEAIEGQIPFTELVALSGDGPMRGFVGSRLIGESGAAAVFEYRWPIWIWLDGSAHIAAGNVFDHRFEGFALENLRLSFGLGVRTIDERDESFDLLVALGTSTFEQGTSVESVRVFLGVGRGF